MQIRKFFIEEPREDKPIYLKGSSSELEFDVKHIVEGNKFHVEGDCIRLVNLGRTVLFGNYWLTSSREKELEN